MAEQDLKQVMLDAIVDADSLEQFINGSDDETVLTRLSAQYPTLQKALKELFENGGIAGRFKTLVELQASPLVDGDYALVADDDAEKNGIYIKDAGSWVKSKYNISDIVQQMLLPNIVKKPKKNLFDKKYFYNDRYLTTGGTFKNLAGWTMSAFIPIKGGETYTVSGTNRRVGLVFYETEDLYTPIASSYETIKSTVIAPVNANYLIINIDTATVKASDVQVEEGAVATNYEPYELVYKIEKSGLPSDIVYKSEFDARMSEPKEYEVIALSKNLFDKNTIRHNVGLLSTDGRLSASLANWGCSADIPVEAGTTYTLSGTRARSGLTFFSDTYNDIVLYVPSADMPLTVTAPEGATKVVFNLYTSAEVGSFSNVQFEKGFRATAYEPFGEKLAVKSDYIYAPDLTPTIDNASTVEVLSNGITNIEGKDSDGNAFKYTLTHSPKKYAPNDDIADVFNFRYFYLNGQQLLNSGDDVAPLRMGGFTVGANHGYQKSVITSNAHGKTNADIGSVWTDGANQYVLIEIKDVNTLSVTARTDNTVLSANSLTYVSGAINTGVINTTNKLSAQWYALTKNRTLKIKADGITLFVGDTLHYKDKLEFLESYQVISKTDLVEWVIANKRTDNVTAEPSALYSNTYSFDKDGGCTIYTSITAYKDIVFQDYMGTQAVPMPMATQEFYVPKSTTVTTTKGTFNFATKEPMPSGRLEGRSIYFNPSTNEVDATPVDRLIMLGGGYGFALGYLPIYDAEPSERLVKADNQYMEIRGNTQKVYPALINSTSITQLKSGDSYGGVVYRKYFKQQGRTTSYIVRAKDADYLYLDWHTATTDTIEICDDLVGREFAIHEKSSNVSLLSKIANNNLVVKVDSGKNYGYLVLRFNK